MKGGRFSPSGFKPVGFVPFIYLDPHRDNGWLHLGDEIGKARRLLLAFRQRAHSKVQAGN